MDTMTTKLNIKWNRRTSRKKSCICHTYVMCQMYVNGFSIVKLSTFVKLCGEWRRHLRSYYTQCVSLFAVDVLF